MTDARSKRVGLIGDPVAHSLSPAFQQPAFDALAPGIRYELWPTPAEIINERLAMLRSGGALGANVTVPHTQAFYAAVDSLSDGAQRAGAVNTIVARDGVLAGHNTDIHGFGVPLIERGFPFDTSRVVVLGAGGAARGVLVALLERNAAEIVVVNRTVARAEDVVRILGDGRIGAAPLADAVAAARGAALIVNATSIGWEDTAPPVDPAVFDVLGPSAIAYDLTYRDTAFLRAAAQRGLATLDGLEMLVHQGAKSFELWTGIAPPIELMLDAARAARNRAIG
jgi:shikimate dehydrogenase